MRAGTDNERVSVFFSCGHRSSLRDGTTFMTDCPPTAPFTVRPNTVHHRVRIRLHPRLTLRAHNPFINVTHAQNISGQIRIKHIRRRQIQIEQSDCVKRGF